MIETSTLNELEVVVLVYYGKTHVTKSRHFFFHGILQLFMLPATRLGISLLMRNMFLLLFVDSCYEMLTVERFLYLILKSVSSSEH